jgi:hypothetical protein
VRIGAGIREGRFILGQSSQLLVQTSDLEGEPLSAELTLETQGLEITGQSARTVTRTNPQGRVSVTVIPRDFTVSLKLLAVDASAKTGEFVAEIPVEATAFFAKKDRQGIDVESSIPSDVLDYAVVTERGLWARGTLSLNCAESKNCRGRLPRETLPADRAWLILGREPALDGASNVGFALDDCDGPCSTVTFREAMLLDGKPSAMAAYRQAESVRRRRILTVSAITGGAFLGALAWLLLRAIVRGQRGAQRQSIEDPLPLTSLGIGIYWLLFFALAVAAIGVWISSRALQ